MALSTVCQQQQHLRLHRIALAAACQQQHHLRLVRMVLAAVCQQHHLKLLRMALAAVCQQRVAVITWCQHQRLRMPPMDEVAQGVFRLSWHLIA